MIDKLLTLTEVAEITRLSENTLRWFRHVGKGPASAKLGRRVVYKESVVLKWVEEQFAAVEAV